MKVDIGWEHRFFFFRYLVKLVDFMNAKFGESKTGQKTNLNILYLKMISTGVDVKTIKESSDMDDFLSKPPY